MREFVGVDGEGIHDRYVLFAAGEQSLYRREGIPLDEAIDWLSLRYSSSRIYTAFAFHYDVCKMVEHYPDDWVLDFMRGNEKQLGDWLVRYLPKHMLTARRAGRQMVIYDVIQFFNRSFENAMIEMGVKDDTGLIAWGKEARGRFTFAQVDKIKAYNAKECELLASMMAMLAGGMAEVGIRPSSWHGPGALANAVLAGLKLHSKEIVHNHRQEMRHVFDSAYFGGRIETPQLGLFRADVLGSGWEGLTTYDIRSAYPEACTQLWNPQESYWFDVEHWSGARFPWSVWHLEWRLPRDTYLGPLPWREQSGRIYYPLTGRGWYWWPEASLAIRLHGKHIKVLEGYVYGGTMKSVLSAAVPELYSKRARLRAEGRKIEAYTLKLVLNSLYGKMAQTVGNNRFHSREWAGYVTSYVRAKLRESVYGVEERVVALATDGIVFDGKQLLSLTEGVELGQWERDTWDEGIVLGSGIYELRRQMEYGTERKRGERGGRLDFDEAMRQLNEHDFVRNKFTAFVTPTLAILMPNHYGPWKGRFMPQERIIAPWNDPHAKRIYEWADPLRDWTFSACNSKPQFGFPGVESTPYEIDEDADRFTHPSGAWKRMDELLIAAD